MVADHAPTRPERNPDHPRDRLARRIAEAITGHRTPERIAIDVQPDELAIYHQAVALVAIAVHEQLASRGRS